MDVLAAPNLTSRQKANRRHRRLRAGRRKPSMIDLPPKPKKTHYPKQRGYLAKIEASNASSTMKELALETPVVFAPEMAGPVKSE